MSTRNYCRVHGLVPPTVKLRAPQGGGCFICGARLLRTPTEYTAFRSALLCYSGLTKMILRCPAAVEALREHYGNEALDHVQEDRRIACTTMRTWRTTVRRYPELNTR